MKTLREVLGDARQNKVAVGHFNISDLAGLKAVFESARALHVPVLVGLSEGERAFMGVRETAAAVKVLRHEYDYPDFPERGSYTFACQCGGRGKGRF